MSMSRKRSFRNWVARYRFTVLVFTLMINLLVAPVIVSINSARHPNLGSAITFIAFTLFLLASALAVSRKRWTAVCSVTLVMTTLAISCALLREFNSTLYVLRESTLISTLGFVVILLVFHVFRQKRVTLDLIYAALCAYLLIGLLWASAYALIELAQPGSFRLPDSELGGFADHGVHESVRRVYFSFVTLLTLGYGDLVPVGSVARLFVVIETFVGQVFLVVLVARLVGVNVGQEMLPQPDHSEE